MERESLIEEINLIKMVKDKAIENGDFPMLENMELMLPNPSFDRQAFKCFKNGVEKYRNELGEAKGWASAYKYLFYDESAGVPNFPDKALRDELTGAENLQKAEEVMANWFPKYDR